MSAVGRGRARGSSVWVQRREAENSLNRGIEGSQGLRGVKLARRPGRVSGAVRCQGDVGEAAGYSSCRALHVKPGEWTAPPASQHTLDNRHWHAPPPSRQSGYYARRTRPSTACTDNGLDSLPPRSVSRPGNVRGHSAISEAAAPRRPHAAHASRSSRPRGHAGCGRT